MALSADARPHFTTLAGFVRDLDREIVGLFRDVLLYASELGLIGKEHFAADGCKLPSNASKQWSGTHRELDEKRKKLERVAERIVDRHRQCDVQEADGAKANDEKKVEKYRRKVEKIAGILDGGNVFQRPGCLTGGPGGNGRGELSNVRGVDDRRGNAAR